MSKELKKVFKLLILIMLVCIFFPISFAKSDATIEGVSGNKIILTGLIGNNPKHFFEDADKTAHL